MRAHPVQRVGSPNVPARSRRPGARRGVNITPIGRPTSSLPAGTPTDHVGHVLDALRSLLSDVPIRELRGVGHYGTRKVALVRELDRLWQGVPAGSLPKCKSPFGVYDTTGNVDEYTTSLSSKGSPAILKGGYWGPVRTRCRPSTRVHGPEHAFYQQGFRCCRDGSAAAPNAGK
jgi:hypothetical protein